MYGPHVCYPRFPLAKTLFILNSTIKKSLFLTDIKSENYYTGKLKPVNYFEKAIINLQN